jgi:uncharacterized protein YkwD
MRPVPVRPVAAHPIPTGPLRALVVVLTALLVALGTSATARATTWPVPTTRTSGPASSLTEFEDQLMVEVNRARRSHGRDRIRVYDACTDRLAERWGRHLAETGRFEHRDQRTVLRRCRATWAGENLVRGTNLSPEAMVAAWLDSPGHRAIMLNGKARRAGVSVTRDGQGRLIGVLNVVRAP